MQKEFYLTKEDATKIIERLNLENSNLDQESISYGISKRKLSNAVKFHYPNFSFRFFRPLGKNKFVISLHQVNNIIQRIKLGQSTLDQESNFYQVAKATLLRNIRNYYPSFSFRNIIKYHRVDHDFFENIGPNQMYIMGLIASDGLVNSKDYGHKDNFWEIRLTLRDCYILEKIRLKIKNKNTINYWNANNKTCQIGCLSIFSKKMVEQLINLGITPRKSLIFEVNPFFFQNKNLFWHFLRGLFDGDGSVSSYKGQYFFNISGTYLAMEQIASFLFKEYGFGQGRAYRNKKNSKSGQLCIGGNIQVSHLYRLLYQDAELFLTRKYDKVKELFISRSLELPLIYNK